VQPAFFGLEIDARERYPTYARAEELGLVVAIFGGPQVRPRAARHLAREDQLVPGTEMATRSGRKLIPHDGLAGPAQA
jgi:hypothetical protein